MIVSMALLSTLLIDFESSWSAGHEIEYRVTSPDEKYECTVVRVKGDATTPRVIEVYVSDKASDIFRIKPVFVGSSIADISAKKSVEVSWVGHREVQIKYFQAKTITLVDEVKIENQTISILLVSNSG